MITPSEPSLVYVMPGWLNDEQFSALVSHYMDVDTRACRYHVVPLATHSDFGIRDVSDDSLVVVVKNRKKLKRVWRHEDIDEAVRFCDQLNAGREEKGKDELSLSQRIMYNADRHRERIRAIPVFYACEKCAKMVKKGHVCEKEQ